MWDNVVVRIVGSWVGRAIGLSQSNALFCLKSGRIELDKERISPSGGRDGSTLQDHPCWA